MTTIINHLLNIEEADLDQPDDIFEEMEEEYADTHNHGEAFVEIGVGSMRNGIRFKDHDIGVKSIENWCKLAFVLLQRGDLEKENITVILIGGDQEGGIGHVVTVLNVIIGLVLIDLVMFA